MEKISILNTIVLNKEKRETFSCPSCKEVCEIIDNHCNVCGYDLDNYKSIMFSHYNYFNSALDKVKEGKYFEAIVFISKYLAYEEDDADAYKIFIFCLYKDGKEDFYRKELEKFESRFPRNSLIFEIESKGIENIELPKCKIMVKNCENSFKKLKDEYLNDRFKNLDEIVQFIVQFYDFVRLCKSNGNKSLKNITKFYEEDFLQYLSKKEISLETFDGRKLEELTNEEMLSIDSNRVSQIKYKKMESGTIITVQPTIKVRSKIIKKQQIMVVQ